MSGYSPGVVEKQESSLGAEYQLKAESRGGLNHVLAEKLSSL
jgi:hypothetical protein